MVKQLLIRLRFPSSARIAVVALVALLTTVTPGSAQFGGFGVTEQPVSTPRSVLSFPRPTAAEAKIIEQLSESTSVDWTDKSLEEALSDLEEQHGIEIWLDKQAMQDQGIDTEEEISLQMDEIPLRSCLKLILEPLGLVYIIEDDVMKVTSQASHATKHITRIYPVGDLCETPDEATQLLETIECGLGTLPESSRFVVSAKLKTLTVRASYTVQEKVQELILALRDAQAANNPAQRN